MNAAVSNPYQIVASSEKMTEAQIKAWLEKLEGFLNEYEQDGQHIRDAIDSQLSNQVLVARGIKAAKDAGEIDIILRALIDLRSDLLDSLCVTALKGLGRRTVPKIIAKIEDIEQGREPAYAEHKKNLKILYGLLADISGKKPLFGKLKYFRKWYAESR